MSLTGLVFNIQRFSIHDGPGVRTTVFLKGCPADCWWCHNPEARSATPELAINPAHCITCGACVEACPTGAATPAGDAPGRHLDHCSSCGTCADVCPTEARLLVGREVSVAEVIDEVERDVVFYAESGGGVTFSGGEPMAQPEFLVACLQECRARGIHTVVDTCGAASEETMLRVAAHTDLFLYDVKHLDDDAHRRYVGLANGRILSNLQALARVGADVWIRVPVIPGVNDDATTVAALGGFISELPRAYPVYLLPYHAIGADKYRRLGEPYRLDGVASPSAEALAAIAATLRGRQLKVEVGA